MNSIDKKMLRTISGAGLRDLWTQGYKQKLAGDALQKQYQLDIASGRVEIPKVHVPQEVKNVGLAFTKGCYSGGAVGAARAGVPGAIGGCLIGGAAQGSEQCIEELAKK